MKAMVLRENRPIETSPLRMEEVADPHPGVGEVRIKVSHCAICRTDLHVIEGELSKSTLPIILGHQVVGYVDEIGPGCHDLKVGDRVGIAWLHSTCENCDYCQTGKENLCEKSLYTGYDVKGGFAEYAVARESYVYPIPGGIGSLEATPLLCAGIIGYRALMRSQLPESGTLGIFGFGSSVHTVIQLAIARGSKIYVVTRAKRHQELARSLGASWAGDLAQSLPAPLDSAILFAPVGISSQ